ncbi:MAG: sterol desaturase family protein [Planctomycetaceae bacterium]|nr:sterol desaturase family protein [Planctomycetaceae bacterium]
MAASSESWIRLGSFLAILLLMNLWEWLSPRRSWNARRSPRLVSNYLLAFFNTIVLRLLGPFSAVAAAIWCEEQQFGLFYGLSFGYTLNVIATIVMLDLAIYAQHVLFHAIPLFWRIHRVHHADLDLDVSSGLRFHTLEIILSMAIKIGIVIMLGAAPWGVMLFEVILNGCAMFNHSNVHLPLGLDRWLRKMIVTPDMHRVHHSVHRRETNSNFGFNLSLWDRLFQTYIDQPRDGHDAMEIGLPEYRDQNIADRIPGMLSMPFRANNSQAD